MKRFNLLPPEQRGKASRDRGMLYAILGLVVLVLALGAIYLQQNSVVNDRQAELDRLNAENQIVQAQLAELQPYAEIHNLRTAMTETAVNIYDARVPWSNIVEEVSLVIPENVRLQTMNCVVPLDMLPGPAQPETTADSTPTVDVTFTGDTYTHKDVAEFMTRLGLIPQLTDIQLASSTESTGPVATAISGSTVTFTVTASLRSYIKSPPTTTLQTAGGAQ